MIVIKNPVCYIVGACKDSYDDMCILKKENDLVIAADGGYDALLKMNITPDLVLGDFDSVLEFPEHKNVIKYPVEKDDTDTFLAYEAGKKLGYEYFVIYGGIGGRIDHTIANIQALSNIAEHSGRAFLLGNGAVMTVIHNSYIEFTEDYKGKISVFSVGKASENVKIEGLKYTAQNILLNSNVPLGVSNEFVGERAKISVDDGNLLIIWYENPKEFIKNIDNFLIK